MSLSDKLEEGKAKVGKGVTDAAEKTKDVAGDAYDKTKELAGTAAEKIKEVAGTAAEKTKEVAGTVVEKAKGVTHKGDAKAEEETPPVVDDSAGSE
jgi:hypothetical protein